MTLPVASAQIRPTTQAVNIATMNLGRDQPGGNAICLVAIDERVTDEVLAKVLELPLVK